MIDNKLIELLPTLPLIENPENINESTRLVQDLHIYGYQAKMFLYKYSEEYNVDISRFHFKKYFPKASSLNRIFDKYFRKQKETLTLGELQKAIIYKRLSEKVIEDIRTKQTSKEERKSIRFHNESYHSSKKDNITYAIILIIFIAILSFIASIF